jgi:3-methylcrotonyl-CoA carboxylase alpha subunit
MTKTKKITKILIANRGEIACRVIKTARKMGIATVAVYSDADRKALHMRMADEAVHIGPSPAVESYLVIEKIIAAAKETDADAVHPGYGFLSENPDFVRACEKAKITFIGPSAEAMEAMGLKDAAKKLMDAAGVPITPGYHGKDQSPKLLKAKAGMIGYPVLIKAVAGGGGKGMRKVEAESDFDAALASCRREAASSFGNADVLIEKYIQSPRHIEVQVFGDSHGNIVHMFERDCSLQRRHQKVIEEAPAPGMTDAVRKAMTDAAINAAKAVNYVGAGTVEFIVDGSGKLRTDGFWFMEMNTRLQVEHPVTEMITGLDLVEWQIRVAQGEKLPKQKDVKMDGHAIEARLYAEEPENDFLPSSGLLYSIYPESWKDKDEDNSGYRIDTGVQSKDYISIFYDPMIAKVIGYGNDRDEANVNTRFGICEIQASGIKTNSRFLINCLDKQVFRDGKLSTSFIPDRPELIGENIEGRPEIFVLAALRLESRDIKRSCSPFTSTDGWRLNQSNVSTWIFSNDGKVMKVDILTSNDSEAIALVNSEHSIRISFEPSCLPISSLYKPEEALNFYDEWAYAIRDDYVSLTRNGTFTKAFFQKFDDRFLNGSSDTLTAPMPGKIIALNCAIGDTVSKDDPLIVMEAMKMEQTLNAPRDGIIAEIGSKVGELVIDGALLVRLEDIEEK